MERILTTVEMNKGLLFTLERECVDGDANDHVLISASYRARELDYNKLRHCPVTEI